MPAKSNKEEFIRRAKLVHGNKYDYSKVNYVNNRTKVIIICPEHGEFEQVPDSHLRGSGCPICRWKKAKESIRKAQGMTTDEFIERAKKVHGNKYDYSKVKYENTETKVCIICPKHGEFWQTPHHHLNGIGCPHCGAKKYDTKEFIRRAKEIHGDKYDYSKTNFIGKKYKVIITCPIHGDFEQLPLNHLKGYGCPECGRHFGKQEKAVLKLLKEKYEHVEYQYTNDTFLKGLKKNLTLDYFLPDYNIGIEYQGIQHFYPQNVFGGQKAYDVVYERDFRKYERCKEHGIPIFYISFEKKIPEDYFAPVYKTFDDLANAIDIYISEKEKDGMKQITESDIRKMVAESLKMAIKENFEGEYRTKGSLNKKTLEKNAGKSAEEIIADREKKAAEDAEYNPDWDESMEDILSKYREDDEYDDSMAGGEYKIDKANPYFYTKTGERVDADAIGNFHNDFAIVKKDGQVNYVDCDGKILSDEWFDACNDFEDGFGMVSKDRKRNFVDSSGNLLLGDNWADRAGDFIGGSAPIIINGERHNVDRNGRIF